MGDKKKIVLADAAEEFRQMLADMIGGEADLTVCAQTASGEELLDLIARHRPDVVVMDLMLSGMDGLEVLEELGEDRPKVLVLSALGHANMWAAVFADVGVSVLAILNASRMLKAK